MSTNSSIEVEKTVEELTAEILAKFPTIELMAAAFAKLYKTNQVNKNAAKTANLRIEQLNKDLGTQREHNGNMQTFAVNLVQAATHISPVVQGVHNPSRAIAARPCRAFTDSNISGGCKNTEHTPSNTNYIHGKCTLLSAASSNAKTN